MSLVKWKPAAGFLPTFSSMVENFFSDEDFRSFWPALDTVPAVNVSETDKAFTVEVAVPGMKKEDFKVEVKDGMLTILAEAQKSNEEKKENYMRREFSYNAFKRTFWIPENVKPEEILAKYDNGLLKIELPKAMVTPAPKGKTIEIS